MLSRTLGVMFKVKQVLTENDLFLLRITLFLVYFNTFEIIRSPCLKPLKVSKIYQNNEVTLITKLLRVHNSFSLYYEITWSDL